MDGVGGAMMATRKTDGWAGGCTGGRSPDKPPLHTASKAAAPEPAPDGGVGGRSSWRDRENRMVEALLEFTTIAGLFALLFALFVLFGAAQTLTP